MKRAVFLEVVQDAEKVLLLDIREVEELGVNETIKGSTHMPMGKVFTEAVTGNLPKDKLMIVFCRSGFRAAIVARELKALGYTIEPLEGGLMALEEAK